MCCYASFKAGLLRDVALDWKELRLKGPPGTKYGLTLAVVVAQAVERRWRVPTIQVRFLSFSLSINQWRACNRVPHGGVMLTDFPKNRLSSAA